MAPSWSAVAANRKGLFLSRMDDGVEESIEPLHIERMRNLLKFTQVSSPPAGSSEVFLV